MLNVFFAGNHFSMSDHWTTTAAATTTTTTTTTTTRRWLFETWITGLRAYQTHFMNINKAYKRDFGLTQKNLDQKQKSNTFLFAEAQKWIWIWSEVTCHTYLPHPIQRQILDSPCKTLTLFQTHTNTQTHTQTHKYRRTNKLIFVLFLGCNVLPCMMIRALSGRPFLLSKYLTF